MKKRSDQFDYTASARKSWFRFPLLTYLGIQVNFWVIANLLLGTIMHLQAMRIGESQHLTGLSQFGPVIIVSIIFGMLYGILVGLAGYYLEKTFYQTKSLGKIILLNTALSITVLILLLSFVRVVLVDLLMSSFVERYPLSNKSWEYFFMILAVYYFFMTLLINFINQVNKKYGPGVLVPLLLGKYRRPQEEERIFMFMDLKSSTTLAEKLGHLQYSSFIRDCFIDINHVVSAYDAEIYQYAGDEIVLSWRMKSGVSNAACLHFYFACMAEFSKRISYYKDHYDILPEFKAGVHGGTVTAVEIGLIKRDIAYHGDVLNTAARIQAHCNDYGQQLLISTSLMEKINLAGNLQAKMLGHVRLKGKQEVVGIAAITN